MVIIMKLQCDIQGVIFAILDYKNSNTIINYGNKLNHTKESSMIYGRG